MSISVLITRALVSGRMTDHRDHVAAPTHQRQIRHVTVMDHEALVGLISIRDLIPELPGSAAAAALQTF